MRLSKHLLDHVSHIVLKHLLDHVSHIVLMYSVCIMFVMGADFLFGVRTDVHRIIKILLKKVIYDRSDFIRDK